MRIVILGAPGSGKGTQAILLAQDLNVPHISTGDIFRAKAQEHSDLGRTVKSYLDAGEYVPEEIANALVTARLQEPGTLGFVLDGYPRTQVQLNVLDDVLTSAGTELQVALLLEVEAEELIQRLLARAASSGRSDDNEPVIRRRQQLYLDATAPLVERYANRGILRRVEGHGAVDVVAARIRAAIGADLPGQSDNPFRRV